MKIAIVHEFLTQLGGAERVLEALCELYPDAPIYTLVYNKSKTGKVFGKYDIRTSFLQKMPFINSSLFGIAMYKWYLPLMPKAVELFDLSEYDLVISSSSAFAKGVIKNPKSVHVCYCYSPTRYLWNETSYYLKTAGIPWPISKIMPWVISKLRKWDYKAAQHPDYFIGISKEIKNRIEKYYDRKADVIYPFVDNEKFQVSKNIKDYYLIAGRMVPYKRNDIVVEAFNNLDLPLKVIGDGYGLKNLKKIAKSSKIEFLGRVSDSELKRYLSECKALIFPSNEDFGILPLEVNASGRPVIAYKKGGSIETVKDGVTGVFFNEQTPESLIKAIKNFHLEKYNPTLIREYAMSFDKKVFKKEFKEYIEKILTNKTHRR